MPSSTGNEFPQTNCLLLWKIPLNSYPRRSETHEIMWMSQQPVVLDHLLLQRTIYPRQGERETKGPTTQHTAALVYNSRL